MGRYTTPHLPLVLNSRLSSAQGSCVSSRGSVCSVDWISGYRYCTTQCAKTFNTFSQALEAAHAPDCPEYSIISSILAREQSLAKRECRNPVSVSLLPCSLSLLIGHCKPHPVTCRVWVSERFCCVKLCGASDACNGVVLCGDGKRCHGCGRHGMRTCTPFLLSHFSGDISLVFFSST